MFKVLCAISPFINAALRPFGVRLMMRLAIDEKTGAVAVRGVHLTSRPRFF